MVPGQVLTGHIRRKDELRQPVYGIELKKPAYGFTLESLKADQLLELLPGELIHVVDINADQLLATLVGRNVTLIAVENQEFEVIPLPDDVFG